MASRVVLVRHGETEWSATGRHTGRTDIGLTGQGEEEARLVVPTLAAWSFSSVFSSPLQRALHTAQIAGFDPQLDDNLMEWDYGEIEGRRVRAWALPVDHDRPMAWPCRERRPSIPARDRDGFCIGNEALRAHARHDEPPLRIAPDRRRSTVIRER